MATTTKKTTTAKTATVKKESVATPVKEEVKAPEPKHFDPDTKVTVRSVIEGGLYFEGSKTHETYSFSAYGDENEIAYRDLTSAIQSNSPFIFAPYFIVEDEDFIAQNKKLADFYKTTDLTNLKSILDLPASQMEQRINTFSKETKYVFKTVVLKAIEDHELDSMNKINILSRFYNVDFSIMLNEDND